jgi:hypothetical protein
MGRRAVSNCGPDVPYEWPMTAGNLAGTKLCNTNLYINVSDYDGNAFPCSGSIDSAVGPAWSAMNNEGCPLDDPAGSSFVAQLPAIDVWDATAPLLMFVR